MKNRSDKNNQDLKNKAEVLRKNSTEIMKSGQSLMRVGQLGKDFADSVDGLLQCNPTNYDFNLVDSAIQGMNSTFRSVKEETITFEPVISSTSASTITVFSNVFNPDNVNVLADDQYVYLVAYSKLDQLTDQLTDKEKAIRLLIEFGFDQGYSGKKSPLEHFQTAYDAFESPVNQNNPVDSSLLPMRSAIEDIIATLLRKRPKQIKTGRNLLKIKSIGNQLCRQGIGCTTITSWAEEYKRLISQLSSAKDDDFTREKWRILIRDSTIFIQEFLEGLDPQKMRNQ